MIERRSPEYMLLWESLTLNQKKTLKLVLINDGANELALGRPTTGQVLP